MDEELKKLQGLRREMEIEREEMRKQQMNQINDEEKEYHINHDKEDEIDNAMEYAVKSWLKHTVRLSQYIDNFIKNGFDDIEVIQETMSMDDLDEIGIKKLGHKKKIMLFIDKLKLNENNDVDPHMF